MVGSRFSEFQARLAALWPSRAQSSLELLGLLAIQLLVLALLWYVLNSNLDDAQHELEVNKAKNAASKLSDAAQLVSLQGPPARVMLVVDLPTTVRWVNASGNEITINISSHGGVQVYAYSPVTVEGNVTPTGGTAFVSVEAQVGKVLIRG